MSTRHEPITVLIADDHEITRKGIRHFLEQVPDIQVIGEAQDGIETRQLVAELRPRIVLLDLLMPNHSPIEFEKWVQADYPETRTLVLTAHARDVYLSGMMDAGAVGFLDKKLKGIDLLNTIRRAARGEAVYTKEQMERTRRWRENVSRKWESLSKREREVLQMLTEGAKNKMIAESLGVTVKTVQKHLENIYQKLGVTSRAEAIHWWIEKNT